jgi:hypothetical protein
VTTKWSKPVSRETSALVFSRGARKVVVTIHDTFVELRLKGHRRSETADLASLYRGACAARVFKEAAERRKRKKGKKS